MFKKLRPLFAFVLSFLLCWSTVPAYALDEAMGEVSQVQGQTQAQKQEQGQNQLNETAEGQEQEQLKEQDPEQKAPVSPAQVTWRTHVLGDTAWEEGQGWKTFSATETLAQTTDDAQAQARTIDTFEARLADGLEGISYRMRDVAGTWQDTWASDGAQVTSKNGFTGVELRLSDELESSYDLWWRTRVAGQSWGAWQCAPSESDLAVPDANTQLPLLEDVQITLVQDGNEPPANEQQKPSDEQQGDGETTVETKDPEETKQDTKEPEQTPAEQTPTEKTPAEQTPTEKTPAEQTPTEQPEQTTKESAKEPEQAPAEQKTKTDEQTAVKDLKQQEVTDKDKASKTTETLTDTDAKQDANAKSESTDIVAQASTPEIEYRAHVQNIGWQGWVKNGAMAGTSGRGFRVEGFYMHLNNASGNVHYQTHVQNIGWQKEVTDNQMAGTEGRAFRIEAIKIWLTGAVAQKYDVWYRGHVQNIGWQGWVKNGEIAGTSGQALRVESIEVLLIEKGGAIPTSSGSSYKGTPQTNTPGVYYQGHVQNIGWQNEVGNGALCGTSGKALRVEALRIKTSGINGGIKYSAHVQNIGWQNDRSDGALCGTSGQGLRLEAFKIELTGAAKNDYNVFYRTHVQNVGWMGWAKNGEMSGTSGFGYRMEALQVKILPKSAAAPSNADADTSLPFVNSSGLSVQYSAFLAGSGWQSTRKDGSTAGATGASARVQLIKASVSDPSHGGIQYSLCMPDGSWSGWQGNGAQAGTNGKNPIALKMRLTGEYTGLYKVWYRVHIANVGWLDWTCDDTAAGNDSYQNPIEAFEVRVIPRESSAPGATGTPFYYSKHLNGVDISGWNKGIDVTALDADFVIIKATEGVHGTIYNPSYATWANQALSQGKLVGFYHYANGGNAVAEADSFYEAIKGFRGRVIACLDWEGQGNPTFNTGRDVEWCKTFLDRLRSRFGGTPFLYTSKSYCNAYDWTSVSNTYPLWGAQYASNNPVYGYQSNPWQSSSKWGSWGKYPTIFQYSGNGQLARDGGNPGSLDLNLFYGARSDWNRYL